MLKSFIFRSLKRQCQTRWSSSSDAVEVMYEELDKIIASLDHLLEGDYSRDTKSDTGALLHFIYLFYFIYLFSFLLTINLKLIIVRVEIKIVNKEAATKRIQQYSTQQLPFISLLNFWYPILKSVDKVSKRLPGSENGVQ